MSESDVQKGSRGLEEISKALDTIEVGVTCLTPENLSAPWLLFEAGALSKRIGERSRLCTYLLGGLAHGDVPHPLGMFQHTRAEKDETRKMLDAVNRALNPEEPVNLDRVFDRLWPDLEKEIEGMPVPERSVSAKRPVEEVVADILEIVRDLRPSQPNRLLADMADHVARERLFSDPVPPSPLSRIGRAGRTVGLVCSKCGSDEIISIGQRGVQCVRCGAVNSLIREIEPSELGRPD